MYQTKKMIRKGFLFIFFNFVIFFVNFNFSKPIVGRQTQEFNTTIIYREVLEYIETKKNGPYLIPNNFSLN